MIVKNSKDLAQRLSEVIIEDDEIFASHDMVSLFMNTPIDKALQIIRDRLNNDKTLKKRTLLNPDDVMDLFEFILTTTYFNSEASYTSRSSALQWGALYHPWWQTSTWNVWSPKQ